MAQLTVATLTEHSPPSHQIGEELHHSVCCIDDNTAQCGVDATNMAWQEGPTTCVVCAYFDEVDYCPLQRRPCSVVDITQ